MVVLSNNDGCAIARSNEAKALGIKMGAPWFQIRHLAESEGLVALSANFALYGDLSDRMLSLAAGLGPRQEIYSIDESFIDLTGVRGDLTERSHKIRSRILQWVGIPCRIGIGPTKTLAKLANHIAKTAERKPGTQYSRSTTVPLRRPSADTALIVNAALAGLGAIYKHGFKYAKAGVMLLDLQSDSVQQGELDLQDGDAKDRGRLMSALDGLNQRYGRGTVLMASAGLAGDERLWSMRQERRTPGYTTRWEDMPVAWT